MSTAQVRQEVLFEFDADELVTLGVQLADEYGRNAPFPHIPDAVHGHPQPVVDPPQGSRRCLSMYYSSKERPVHELMAGRHSVVFSGEDQAPACGSRVAVIRELVTPPIVGRGLRRVRRTLRGQEFIPMSHPTPGSVDT